MLVLLLTGGLDVSAREVESVSNSNEKLNVGTVTLEWDAVPGARDYTLRFEEENDSAKQLHFVSKEPKYQQQIPSGHYKFQIRSNDKRGPGPWSEPISLSVERLETLNLKPHHESIIEGDASLSEESIDFEWRTVSNVKFYYFMITDLQGFKKKMRVDEPKLRLSLKRGRKYIWKAIPILANGVIHETQGKPFQFYIQGNRLKMPLISEKLPPDSKTIEWESVAGARSYLFLLSKRALLDEPWKKVIEKEIRETRFSLDRQWKPGEYKIEVQALSNVAPPSPAHERAFAVKPKLDELSSSSRN